MGGGADLLPGLELVEERGDGLLSEGELMFFQPARATMAGMSHVPPRAVALAREFWTLMADNDFDRVGRVLSPGFVLDWPQSRERIRGPAAFARMNAEYPAHGPWRFTVHRIVGDERQAASDVSVTDGAQVGRALTFFTVSEEGIDHIVEFWPEPFAAAAWRAHLVERMPDDE